MQTRRNSHQCKRRIYVIDICKVLFLTFVSFVFAFVPPLLVSFIVLSMSGYLLLGVLLVLLIFALYIVYVSPEGYRYFYAATLGAFFCLNTIYDAISSSGVSAIWPYAFSLIFLSSVLFANTIAINGRSVNISD